MEEVNALKIRNNLGAILDRLNETGEPIFVSKGRILNLAKREKNNLSSIVVAG